MENNKWSMKMNGQPTIVHWNLGPHFVFWDGNEDDSMPPMPLFSSPHADILKEDENTRACMRLKTLIRLANGISLITRGEPLLYLDTFYHHKRNTMQHASWNHNRSIIMEELIFPFDEDVIMRIKSNTTIKKRTAAADYAELVVTDRIAMDLILYLSLALEDELYMLVNIYKIYETINNTVGTKIDDDNFKEKYKFESYRKLRKFTKYINTHKGSGPQSRHPHNEKEKKADIKIPKYEDLVDHAIKAASEWMNYQCGIQYGRQHPISNGLSLFYKDPDKFFDL
ncbi:hypothetical protein BGP34_13585 [Bacillus mycoides]|uniref:hypothetical protein n=1 Tax=Bacillus mycoides TaxID=1405 RepID=UPI000991C302|nr:hypothetical protein [Bacillus mycoides]OOR57507.1 hypothetical protein BGP34_13585 [Bacillus mycoides]